jgi:hypothetical protein
MSIDTTKASGNPIPDGIYFVQGEGAAWTAHKFRGGKAVGTTEEANAATHEAARDSWAGIVPSDDDELLDTEDEQLSIDVALACGYDDAYGVCVSRPREC